MTGYILAASGLAAVLIFLWSKPSKIIYIRQLTLPILCTVFILCLIMYSKTAVSAAVRGINLWFGIVFPSLFPFFAASEILSATGFIKAAGILLEPIMRPLFNVPGCGSFALAMGVTSGYPIGAKITCDLREKGVVTKTEAERLLAFTNNSGPLFIVGAVATSMYGAPSLGMFLLICHILACLTVGVLFRFYKRSKSRRNSINEGQILKKFKQELLTSRKINKGAVFGDAVRNSMSLILAIGGYIVLFSVIINLLLETGLIKRAADLLSVLLSPTGINNSIISAVLSGFFEITTGTSLVSGIKEVSLAQQLTATSLIIGWAGLSVHSQVLGIVSKTDISIKPYLFGKMLQGIFAAIYTWIGVQLLGTEILISRPVFNNGLPVVPVKWQEAFLSSCLYLIFILASFGLLYIISLALIHKKKMLRH